jgi:hypothetical protein
VIILIRTSASRLAGSSGRGAPAGREAFTVHKIHGGMSDASTQNVAIRIYG